MKKKKEHSASAIKGMKKFMEEESKEKKKISYVNPSKPNIKFQEMLNKAARRMDKKPGDLIKQFGDKGYKPSTGKGVGYKRVKRRKMC